MLYLRTGGNGSGKSLFTLKDVRELQLSSGRPVCYNLNADGKSYCNIKPAVATEFGWKAVQFRDWEAQDDGTIFLIDECHYDLPTRAGNGKPPEHIQKLTEHRRRGFDFFLLTQHPKNIDTFVRNLVQAPGWHQHVKRLMGAAPVSNFVQWDAVELQCEKFGSGKNAQVKTRPFPKDVYEWYDSAQIHTGKVRVPRQVVILGVCAVGIPLLFYLGFSKVLNGGPSASAKADPLKASASLASAGSGSSTRIQTPADYVASYTPRIASLMHTAPAYDELTRPRRVPVPAACVESKSKGCKCYTQDATPYPVDLAMCRQLVANGAFLAFQPEGERSERHTPTVQPRQQAEIEQQYPSGVLAIGGPTQVAAVPVAAPAPQPQRIASIRR